MLLKLKFLSKSKILLLLLLLLFYPTYGFVTESRVQLLATRKPILERQDWWKGKFALFQRLATGAEGGLVSKG